MAYEYQSQESLRVRVFAALMAGVFSVAAITHMATGHRADVERYASPIAVKYTGDDIVAR